MKETCGTRFRKWYIGGVACPDGKTGRRLIGLMDLIHGPFQRWVIKEAALPERMRLLDIGTGGGGFPSMLQRYFPYAEIDACDISPLCVKSASKKLEGRAFVSSAEEIDVKDCSYSVVTALDTVYYWNDIGKAFSEVYRILSESGVFYIGLGMTDKTLSADWASDNPSLRVYSPEELKSYLVSAGFSDMRTVAVKGAKALLRAVKTC